MDITEQIFKIIMLYYGISIMQMNLPELRL